MTKPFSRAALSPENITLLNRGRWGNANLFKYRCGDGAWVVKDFLHCPLPVRCTWGSFMVSRELRALDRLKGIEGIPENSFLLDKFALCYRYISGRTLKESRRLHLDTGYFVALEQLVRAMHERNIVHLDIRYMRNILITSLGRPALLDFQSSIFLENMPHSLHKLLKNVDISGVYKCWHKIAPETMDTKRLDLLNAMEKKRSLWIFKGYPLNKLFSRH